MSTPLLVHSTACFAYHSIKNLSIAIKDAVNWALEKNMHCHNSRQVGIVSSVDEITDRPKVFKGLGYLRFIEN